FLDFRGRTKSARVARPLEATAQPLSHRVLLKLGIFREPVLLKEGPDLTVRLRGRRVVVVRMVGNLGELDAEAMLRQHVARASNRFQRKELIPRPNPDRERNLA